MTEITAHHGLLRDTKLHVDDHGGTGRPVVLLHGWPLSGESWKAQLPALRQAGHRAITYDRRGFGRSDKPLTGYGYDTLAEDLHTVLRELDVRDATLVGFSMGGGEVARYLANYGPDRVRSVVFAAAVTPYMMHTPDNPDGPLAPAAAAKMAAGLTADRDRFFDGFITEFFSVGGQLKVTEQQRQEALALTRQAGKIPALECLTAFGNTDFRDDLAKITVPALVLHGDGDATVPFDGSGRRTHAALPGSRLVVLPGAPHGCNVSHPDAFNHALLDFLAD
ncbi:alpha/beta hydrolase [Dactylosporangium vinaceum]|uniref:Alpha/beta fold hydrolase n=1 Tax=Dactylosporangium vinaceum TaxID=53362 RepID=A0ABV5MDE3_9ACTN|nr:alpha/beta hydrolase [Dactylosporangium vinaceum]UAC01176.1 alpha/beta hydrolase [Dactylosporangium vinaceum]